jgi:hypothetical protein
VGQAAGEAAYVAGGGEGALPASPPQASAWIRLCCDSGDSAVVIAHATLLPEHVILHFTLYTLPPTALLGCHLLAAVYPPLLSCRPAPL